MQRVADLFAGWGGFSKGAEDAGCEVVFAANHWELAVTAHQLNHPNTQHVCQDLRQYDWQQMPDYDGLLAGPACQGHSQAGQPGRVRGSRRKHDELRATAWAVVDCVDVTEPKWLLVENVPDFLRWRLYPEWRACLERMGYALSTQVLRASHFGVPQRRDRLFIIGVRGRKAIELNNPDVPEEPFGPCIEWDADVSWTRVTEASVRVRERIAKGRRNHGRRFLTQHVTGHPGVGLDEPIRTITTKDQWAVVDGKWYRPLTIRENARGMSFPDDYTWPPHVRRRDCIKGLGNAVPPKQAKMLVEAVI